MLDSILDSIENVPKRLDDILDDIRRNPKSTLKQLAKKYRVNEKTIKRDFQKLKAHGRLKRIGALKGDIGKRSQTNYKKTEQLERTNEPKRK
ncbi:MAG: DeoR family transcriptional regulator [SAR324 cluster bacterium]|jgi:DeoR/GlpR family transcriptional regulator of sugar metabolism|nr:DeoR family transcriptional regulator [SAR324 cluster bacterium]